jgi:hypothetical protein
LTTWGTPSGTSSGQDPSEPEKLVSGGLESKVGKLWVFEFEIVNSRSVSDQVDDKREPAPKNPYEGKNEYIRY